MRAELHLARCYLFGLRRRTQIATVTLISFIGVAIGVIALVVTLALLEGFQSTIRSELVNQSAHARIKPAHGRHLDNPKKLVEILQGSLPDVEIVQIVRGTCLVVSLTDAVPASVVGRSDAHQVEADQIVASRTGLGVSDQIQIVAPRMRLTPLGPVPIRATYTVSEIRAPEPGAESGSVSLPLEDAQRLLWGRAIVESVEISDQADPWGLGDRTTRALANLGFDVIVENMHSIHRPILLALSLERMMIFVAVGLMLVVAALNLLCNVAMIAAEKRKDLAVLAGLGMPPISLRRLFLFLGLGIGGAGAAAGALLGTMIAVGLDFSGALPLPRGVFVVSAVPFRVQPAALLSVIVLALSLSAAASWLPSRLVARREPAEGLRYE